MSSNNLRISYALFSSFRQVMLTLSRKSALAHSLN